MNNKALVIGIDVYKNQDYNRKGCVVDAINISTTLEHHFDYTTKMLINERATLDNITEQLQWLCTGDEDYTDSLVLYFSGNGSIEYQENADLSNCIREMLCPHDFRWGGNANNGITTTLLNMFFGKVDESVNITIIVDCGFIGDPLTTKCISPPEDIVNEFECDSAYVKIGLNTQHTLLRSSKVFQPTYEDVISKARGGIFTSCLLQVLQEHQWSVILEECKQHVKSNLKFMRFYQMPSIEIKTNYRNIEIFRNPPF